MATRDEIKKAMLSAVGNPSAGLIADNVDRMADAVVALEAPQVEEVKPKREFDQRETRKVEAKETR